MSLRFGGVSQWSVECCYPAPEKLEIIRIVEQSHLPAKLTLDKLGIARRTFYRWYDRYLEGGPEALADRPSAPSRVWNRIPKVIHDQIIELALEQSELSPRELAVRFTDPSAWPSASRWSLHNAVVGRRRVTRSLAKCRRWSDSTAS